MAISLAQSLAKSLAYSLCGGDIPEPVPCTFTFSAGEHGSVSATINGVSVTSPASAMTGDLVVITATPSEHYHLTTWSDGSTQNPYSFRLSGDKTLSASFAIDTFVVTATGTHGSVSGSGTYEYNESCTLLFEPDSHYHFVEWSDGDPNNPRTFNVTENLTVSTVGILDQHTISVSATNGVASGAGTYNWGTTINISVAPNSGYQFTEWSDGNTDNPRSVTVTADASYSTTCEPLAPTVTPLKFTSTGNSIISFTQQGTWTGTWPIETSSDGSTWSSYTLGTSISLSDGQYVYFRGQKDSTPQDEDNYRKFVMSGSISASGDVTSLLNGTGGVLDLTPYGSYTFALMFSNCHVLLSPPVLPSLTLTENCYRGLFKNCFALASVPSLPAISLAQYCCSYMFQNCRAITSPPALPATTLVQGCYRYMFDGCTSLTSAPALPATTLAQYCYYYMFYYCTSLTSAPALPATTLADYCYANMFDSCASLTVAPALPATTLVQGCYRYMFYGCTKLKGTISISATSPYYTGTTTACEDMFTSSGTKTGAGGTIKVGGNVSDWNSTNAGINSTRWTVELITE